MKTLILSLLILLPLWAAPDAPDRLRFSHITAHSVTLHWQDRSQDELGFKIFRDGNLIAIAGENRTTYQDSNLEPEHTYTYTVKASDDDLESAMFAHANPATKAKFIKNLVNYYIRYKKDYFIQVGSDMMRIPMDRVHNNQDWRRTTSESQGYGLLIAVLMAPYDNDAQKYFDALFRFAKKYPSSINPHFMSWEVSDQKGGEDSAFDGDCDIAYALLLASQQWGENGAIHYKDEALKIIDALGKNLIGKESYLPLLGDWVDPDGETYNQYTTRSSDFMLENFYTFYQATNDRKWLKVIDTTLDALSQIQSLPENKTDLVSDFLYYDRAKKHYYPTKRKFLEQEDNSYYYNAARVPFRVGLYALRHDDQKAKNILQKMLRWIKEESKGDAYNIKAGYTLSGEAIGADYTDAVFVAPFGVATLTAEGSYSDFADSIYDYIKENHENYYQDSINLLSQIAISGVWR